MRHGPSGITENIAPREHNYKPPASAYLKITQRCGVQQHTGEVATSGGHCKGVNVERGSEHALRYTTTTGEQRQ